MIKYLRLEMEELLISDEWWGHTVIGSIQAKGARYTCLFTCTSN